VCIHFDVGKFEVDILVVGNLEVDILLVDILMVGNLTGSNL
jgi:hypothetical protein